MFSFNPEVGRHLLLRVRHRGRWSGTSGSSRIYPFT
jgi:hypothetical protein